MQEFGVIKHFDLLKNGDEFSVSAMSSCSKKYIMCFYFVLSYNYNCLLVALVLELVVLSINSMLEFMCDLFTLTSDGSVGALTSLFDSIWGIRITCGSTTNLLH